MTRPISPLRHRLAAPLLLTLALGGHRAAGQIPDRFENLRVLPKEISKGELLATMRGWTVDLGVRCNHCHVGPDDLQGMDFASDELATKRVAREMLRMVQTINAGTIATLPPRDEPRQTVTCMTCHRGAARPPVPLHLELVRVVETAGAAAAAQRYAELRRDHQGDGQYDFRPQVLGVVARRLAESGRIDDAVAMARLGSEQHPQSAPAWAVLGDLLRRRHAGGDREAAMAALRQALALDPQLSAARRSLQELEAPAPAPTPPPPPTPTPAP
jgi:hypothetical protein